MKVHNFTNLENLTIVISFKNNFKDNEVGLFHFFLVLWNKYVVLQLYWSALGTSNV